MKKAEFYIACFNEEYGRFFKKVSGLTCTINDISFGFHQNRKGGWWVITDLKSGCSVGYEETLTAAFRLAFSEAPTMGGLAEKQCYQDLVKRLADYIASQNK